MRRFIILISMIISFAVSAPQQILQNIATPPTDVNDMEVAIIGGVEYLFVADGVNGLKVYDVSTTSGSPTIKYNVNTAGDAVDVTISDDNTTLYLSDSSNGVIVYDISNPTSITQSATYTGNSIIDVASDSSKTFLYLAGGTSNKLYASGIAGSAITVLDTNSTGSTVFDVEVYGNRLYTANKNNGVIVYDIGTDAAKPASVLAKNTGITNADQVLVDANYLYVVSSSSVVILNKTDLSTISTINLGAGVNHIDLENNLLVIGTTTSLDIYDVSTPATPSKIARPSTSNSNLFTVGSKLYTSSGNGFEVTDISDLAPSKPEVRGISDNGTSIFIDYRDTTFSGSSLADGFEVTVTVDGVSTSTNQASGALDLSHSFVYTAGKTYDIKIRSYNTINGTQYYSSYTDTVTIKAGAPSISLNPSGWIESVTSGGTVSKTFTITNYGTGDLTMINPAVSETNDADNKFSYTNVSCNGATVGTGGSCTFTITYDKSVVGNHQATFITASSNDSNISFSMDLTTTATPTPVLEVIENSVSSPATIDFGSKAINASPKTTIKTITIKNNGTGTLIPTIGALTGANTAEYSVSDSCSSTNISAGAECNITVTYQRTAVATHTATMTVNSNGGSHSVNFTGITTAAAAPSMAVNDGTTDQSSNFTYTFPLRVINGGDNTQTFTVKNSGDANITGLNVAITTNTTNRYSITTNNCGTQVGDSGGSCTFVITYDRSVANTANDGVITISSTDAGTILVTLNGETSSAPEPRITVDSNLNDYDAGSMGSFTVGAATPTKTFTISATSGTDTLNITNISSSNSRFPIDSVTCVKSLNNTQTCGLDVNYTIQSSGSSDSTTITIDNNSTNNPSFTITLSAVTNNLGPIIDVNTSAIDFGSGYLSTTTTKTLDINNTGDQVLTLNITDNSARYSSSGCPTSLAAGVSCTLSITYSRSASAATDNATLTIATNDPANSSVAISLTGQTNNVGLVVSSSSINFGSNLDRSDSTAYQTVTLSMSGGNIGDINITNIALNPASIFELGLNGTGGATCTATTVNDLNSCTITLRAVSQANTVIQTYNTNLDITYNSPFGTGLTTQIPLSVTLANLFSFATSISFGSFVDINETKIITFSVTNNGNVAINPLDLYFATNTDSAFAISDDNSSWITGTGTGNKLSITLNPAETKTLYAKFAPLENKIYSYDLWYDYNPSGSGASGTVWGGTPIVQNVTKLPISNTAKIVLLFGFLSIGLYFIKKYRLNV